MYAGWNLSNFSGHILGVHQKFNRVAHKASASFLPTSFPNIDDILHFEGRNGPDGLKHKSPGKDEPRHFYDPFDPEYTELLAHMRMHYDDLVRSMKNKDVVRSAYDSAWLAHVITDGLTPAHHYPYEEELSKIRPKTADSIKGKIIISGDSKRDSIKRNWKFMGAKGLMMTHGLYEDGVAVLLRFDRIHSAKLTDYDFKTLKHIGIEEYFKRAAREIALLDMYDRFYQRGWTPSLAKDTSRVLAPLIAKTIALAWISACDEAELV